MIVIPYPKLSAVEYEPLWKSLSRLLYDMLNIWQTVKKNSTYVLNGTMDIIIFIIIVVVVVW
jgi:hypothetical protein